MKNETAISDAADSLKDAHAIRLGQQIAALSPAEELKTRFTIRALGRTCAVGLILRATMRPRQLTIGLIAARA